MRLGVAVLAAGASRRFGRADKLEQIFRGKPLGIHAVAAIPRDAFANAWVVTSQAANRCNHRWTEAGFETVINERAAEGMGTSVALAAELAGAAQLDGLLIALADMPLVPREHFADLIAEANSSQDILVSTGDGARMPPALFGSDHFAILASLQGDKGARDFLALGRVVDCPAEWLLDIDTPTDLDVAVSRSRP